MTNLLRVRAELSGAAVTGPSVSTFYGDATQTGFPAAVRAFYAALAGDLPNGLTVAVDSAGDIILDTNGSLVGTWSEASGAVVGGTDNNGWVQGVGARVRWNTTAVRTRRRVRGTTFVVPIGKDMFTSAGMIDDAMIARWITAGNTLRAAASGAMRVWSRPHKGAADGSSHEVTGVLVPDQVSWLRSRRL